LQHPTLIYNITMSEQNLTAFFSLAFQIGLFFVVEAVEAIDDDDVDGDLLTDVGVKKSLTTFGEDRGLEMTFIR
jgi:hypothetical protein